MFYFLVWRATSLRACGPAGLRAYEQTSDLDLREAVDELEFRQDNRKRKGLHRKTLPPMQPLARKEKRCGYFISWVTAWA